MTVVREFSSYTWWLKEQVQARSDRAGNVEPLYDFVYLDGAKNWTIDGLAVVLIEKLLRPGGWLLMDDLPWTYAQDPGREATDGIVHRELSEPERTEPHLRAVFDLIVAQHPSFTELKIQDEWWGWARKAPGEPRTLSLETSRPLGALVAGGARARARAQGASGDEEAVAEVELVALEQVGVALGPGAGAQVLLEPRQAGRELLRRAAWPAPRCRRARRGRGRRAGGASRRRRSRPRQSRGIGTAVTRVARTAPAWSARRGERRTSSSISSGK